jgi:hypothetical protein
VRPWPPTEAEPTEAEPVGRPPTDAEPRPGGTEPRPGGTAPRPTAARGGGAVGLLARSRGLALVAVAALLLPAPAVVALAVAGAAAVPIGGAAVGSSAAAALGTAVLGGWGGTITVVAHAQPSTCFVTRAKFRVLPVGPVHPARGFPRGTRPADRRLQRSTPGMGGGRSSRSFAYRN